MSGSLSGPADTLPGKALLDALASPMTWSGAAKQGVGTAFFDGVGTSLSNVWYTLAEGGLTEVYYPTVGCANLRRLEFAVTDRESFFDRESSDTLHEINLPHADALVYRQINRAKNGCYIIAKTCITDPNRHAVLIHTTLRTLIGNLEDYEWYVLVHPAPGNSALGNRGRATHHGDRTWLTAQGGDVAMAVGCDIPLAARSFPETPDAQRFEEAFLEPNPDARSHSASSARQAQDHLPPVRVQAARLLLGSAAQSQEIQFTLTLAFADSEEAALDTADAALKTPFRTALTQYREGWRSYVATLRRPIVGEQKRHQAAAMILKAHEDKLFPGAVAASLSLPWGDSRMADDPLTGGYHLVWPRDLYHVASALSIAGDPSLALRSLRYLQNTLQLPDGSFIQNTWPSGEAYWHGIQLDQTAYAILLTGLVGDATPFWPLVKHAADFLAAYGPYSPQERWEENAGYSPSTLAAVIAGLTVAGDMARNAGDPGAAALYLTTADHYARHVEKWTVATRGPLSDSPYYIRVSDTTDPDDGHWIELKNGGGRHPKSSIVDAGFLELVRLGVRPPDDPVIVNSLNVIDRHLLYEGKGGPAWRRYNHDGYGEYADGTPYDGRGQGHPWPLLAGERGEYEISLAKLDTRLRPARFFGPLRLLRAMCADEVSGWLIAEQIWDGRPIPGRSLRPGRGTGSATPLAWALAQYIRLAEAIRRGENAETPEVVHARYIANPPPPGPTLQIENSSQDGITTRDGFITVRGTTAPSAIVTLASRGRYSWTRADDHGDFRAAIRLPMAGPNQVCAIAYDGLRSVTNRTILAHYRPPVRFATANCNPLSHGRGLFEYPKHPDFKPGDFALTQVSVGTDGEWVYLSIGLGHLDNPWGGPTGLSKQIIDIYLSRPGARHAGQDWTMGLRARFRPGDAWHRLIRVTGNWHGEAGVYDSDWSRLESVVIAPQYAENTVHVAAPSAALGGVPSTGWGFMVVVAGEAGGGPRSVRHLADEWTFGGAKDAERAPLLLDYLVTPELVDTATDLARAREFLLPMIRLP